MEMRKPVNEGGYENGENDMRLFQMSSRGRDDSSGYDRARDHALAVDHPKWVALTLHVRRRVAAFLTRHLAVSQFQH
jgi:hypothetical protein